MLGVRQLTKHAHHPDADVRTPSFVLQQPLVQPIVGGHHRHVAPDPAGLHRFLHRRDRLFHIGVADRPLRLTAVEEHRHHAVCDGGASRANDLQHLVDTERTLRVDDDPATLRISLDNKRHGTIVGKLPAADKHKKEGRRMQVRLEQPADVAAVHAVNTAAFETSAEADLVDALRAQPEPILSVVADDGGSIVGHIVFSPVTLMGHGELHIMGLAPMAVLPAQQRRGVGSALVRDGLERCRQLRCHAVVVLGHPEYYPRFGFVPASRFGIRSEYDVPDDVFMAVEFETGVLKGKAGTIRYHPAFAMSEPVSSR